MLGAAVDCVRPSDIQKRTYEATLDPGAFISNEPPSPGGGGGVGVIVGSSWLGAAESCSGERGGASALHLPARTPACFSVSIFKQSAVNTKSLKLHRRKERGFPRLPLLPIGGVPY